MQQAKPFVPPRQRRRFLALITFCLLCLGAMIVQDVMARQRIPPLPPAFDAAVTQIAKGEWASVIPTDRALVLSHGPVIAGKELESPVRVAWPAGSPMETTVRQIDEAVHAGRASGHDIVYRGDGGDVPEGFVTFFAKNIVVPVVTFGIPILFLIFLIASVKQMHGVLARKPASLVAQRDITVRFQDVAGVDGAKEEVQEVVDFLKNPDRFARLGARIPRGVILHGPPGTGKTMLAKAVAGEAGVPFLSTNGAEFEEMIVGLGSKRVRELFSEARDCAPCIIFIDEIDALARRRGGHAHGVYDQTLNSILVEMDGMQARDQVIVIAATNRLDAIDPAILRPGRFDRHVAIDLPDLAGRVAILRTYTRMDNPRYRIAPSVDLNVVARSTSGFSGAGLENLLNEASIAAAKDGCSEVQPAHLEQARDKVAFGKENRSRALGMTDQDRRTIAFHEAGHAVVQRLVSTGERLHKVSIIPRGAMLGMMMSLPDRDIYHQTRSGLLDRICVLLAGRASERLHCGDVTAGASQDLEQATRIARAMVVELAMEDIAAAYPQGGGDTPLSEQARVRADLAIEQILTYQRKRTEELLTVHRGWVVALVHELLERETVDGPAIDALRPLSTDGCPQPIVGDHPVVETA